MVYQLTTSTPRRLRRREASVERVVETSMKILTEEGLGALTMHRLAEALDYTVGAVYRYFPSKESLLAELERRVVVSFGQVFGRAWERLRAHPAYAQSTAATQALAELWTVVHVFGQL